ncbi:MAG: methyltransferase RsmF C-terminal domain-like protein [Candidatus Pacearchaeota archaeon]
MNLDIYDSKKRKKMLEQLNDRFGITEIPKFLFETGRERVRGFNGELTIDELYGLSRITNVEFLGLYLFRADEDRSVRLSFDACLLLADQITKNIIDIDNEQLKVWMRGDNLPIVMAKGMYIIRHGEDFLGCTVCDGEKLINFVPKERRLRKS